MKVTIDDLKVHRDRMTPLLIAALTGILGSKSDDISTTSSSISGDVALAMAYAQKMNQALDQESNDWYLEQYKAR